MQIGPYGVIQYGYSLGELNGQNGVCLRTHAFTSKINNCLLMNHFALSNFTRRCSSDTHCILCTIHALFNVMTESLYSIYRHPIGISLSLAWIAIQNAQLWCYGCFLFKAIYIKVDCAIAQQAYHCTLDCCTGACYLGYINLYYKLTRPTKYAPYLLSVAIMCTPATTLFSIAYDSFCLCVQSAQPFEIFLKISITPKPLPMCDLVTNFFASPWTVTQSFVEKVHPYSIQKYTISGVQMPYSG